MKFAITLLLFTADWVCCFPDYYWRAFSGDIPDDAVIGGIDKYNRPTYIGQALLSEAAVPGTIYKRKEAISVEYYGVVKTDKNIQILCSKWPEYFTWVPVRDGNITVPPMLGSQLVVGGYENQGKTYTGIGRVYFNNEVVVGKVIREGPKANVLFLAHGNKTFETKSYDTLFWWDIKLPPLPTILPLPDIPSALPAAS